MSIFVGRYRARWRARSSMSPRMSQSMGGLTNWRSGRRIRMQRRPSSRPCARCLAPDEEPGEPLVLDRLGTRALEEQIWSSIAGLAHGEFRQKNDADGIRVNQGKSGGAAAERAHVQWYERRDLEALGDHLHARYRELIAKHEMVGRAEVVDHVFRWETDFEFPWMEGWAKNQQAPNERNIVLMIPGANRQESLVMGDHYDTAYMEDVFYAASGGDSLRAPACGADDNHSATTALLLAAEQLLPLARAGKLLRDVWLVHLTGEEFPSDCMGARALGQALVERRLAFTSEDGRTRDVSEVRVVGAFVLDMIGHNADRDRDVFQIASGEGAASARLARRAHRSQPALESLREVGQPLARARARGSRPARAPGRRHTYRLRRSPICLCRGRCALNGSRARRFSTPMVKSSLISEFR